MRFAGEDVALPGQHRGVHVFIHGFVFRVVRPEDAAECGVSETRVVADAFHEGRVGRVEVLGAPREGPGIEGHVEHGEVAFAALERSYSGSTNQPSTSQDFAVLKREGGG